MQPLAGVQVSAVQGLPSSQETAVPPPQLPFWQVEPVVQTLPSSQAKPLRSAKPHRPLKQTAGRQGSDDCGHWAALAQAGVVAWQVQAPSSS